MYGVALGPAIGWLYEGVDAVTKRNASTLQIIWNALEQFPGETSRLGSHARPAPTPDT